MKNALIFDIILPLKNDGQLPAGIAVPRITRMDWRETDIMADGALCDRAVRRKER